MHPGDINQNGDPSDTASRSAELQGSYLCEYLRANQVPWLDPAYRVPYMALTAAEIPERPVPVGLQIIEVPPGDTELARLFDDTAARSFNISYPAEVYSSGITDDGSIRFFLGMLTTRVGGEPQPVTTMALIDYHDTHQLAEIEDVTTVARYRNRGMAAATIAHVLQLTRGSFEVIFLSPTTKAIKFYHKLGFLMLRP